eukprot:1181380-Prymnesium_polylepis.1
MPSPSLSTRVKASLKCATWSSVSSTSPIVKAPTHGGHYAPGCVAQVHHPLGACQPAAFLAQPRETWRQA